MFDVIIETIGDLIYLNANDYLSNSKGNKLLRFVILLALFALGMAFTTLLFTILKGYNIYVSYVMFILPSLYLVFRTIKISIYIYKG